MSHPQRRAGNALILTVMTNRVSQLHFVVMIVFAAVVLFACGKKKPANPVPQPTYLYALVEAPGDMAIDIIDADSDSVMRRIPSAGPAGPKNIAISPDGRYLASFGGVVAGAGITLFDLETETAVAFDQTIVQSVRFTQRSDQIIGLRGDFLWVYDLPGLTVDTILDCNARFCLNPRMNGSASVIIRNEDPLHDGFRAYSTENWAIVDSFSFLSTYTNGPVITAHAEFSPDGQRLYLLGADGGGLAVFCFDLVTQNMIFRRPVEEWFGSVSVSPTGDEVWVIQTFARGIGPVPLHLGYVLVLDAFHGTPIDTFHTMGLDPDRPDEPLTIQRTFFHPNQRKAFVHAFRARPGILILNPETREMESSIYGVNRTIVWDLRITP